MTYNNTGIEQSYYYRKKLRITNTTCSLPILVFSNKTKNDVRRQKAITHNILSDSPPPQWTEP